MAIALDGSYTEDLNRVGSTKTFAFTVSSASDRYLIVGISQGSFEPDVTGVTWNGTSMTLIGDSTVTADNNCRAYLYGLVAPAATTANIVVTLGGSGNERTQIAAAVYSGVHQTTPIGTAVTALVVGGNPTVNVSSAAGELVVDACSVTSDVTLAAGGGQTQRVATTTGNDVELGMSEEAGAGTVTMSWTGSTGFDAAIVAVPLKPASGGGGSITFDEDYQLILPVQAAW
jgi:hypothetical protein